MKRSWLGVGLFLMACGGSPGAPPPATPKNTKGQACLTDAATIVAAPPNAPGHVELKHILVRHAELGDPKGATRSKEAACLQALAALEALQAGKLDWSEAVTQYSDSKDDDLGRVSQDELDPAFAGAAFSLEVDQLSYVVESKRGYHVILRER